MKASRYNVWVEDETSAYVYNGVSGSLLKIDGRDYRDVKAYLGDRNASTDCSPAVLEQLVRGSMLVHDDADEFERLRHRFVTSRLNKDALSMTLVTSLGCNLDCPYCFETKYPSVMGQETQGHVIRLLESKLPTIKTFGVTWFGGEPIVGKKPLLRLSKVFIDRCDEAGVKYSAGIITNGVLLDAATCRELRDARVNFAQITLDGPPDVHDRMRPQADGGGSFAKILANLHHVIDHMSVGIRVNLDANNFDTVEALFEILRSEGFAGKLSVTPGHIVGAGQQNASAKYKHSCLPSREFAQVALAFSKLAARYGLGEASLPRPTGAPCTAVRLNELVVGSKGELYKCWESVGTPADVVGHIADFDQPGTRQNRWLQYDPFANDECRACIALPVCMGGCAHHALDEHQYENRCGTFRHTYHEQVTAFVEKAKRDAAGAMAPAKEVALA